MTDPTPKDIVDFWFPDGDAPTAEEHIRLWNWRMRGGAHEAVLARFTEVTERAAAGELDHWATTPLGRLALILILDQFTRSVWAGTPRAYAYDEKARDLCLGGLVNGHFDALPNVWTKGAFKIPLEHCEGPDHLANLDRAVAIAEALVAETPDSLKAIAAMGVMQPKRHRAVIARFGRHPHRNAVLGRASTPDELAYLDTGDFPHVGQLGIPPDQTP